MAAKRGRKPNLGITRTPLDTQKPKFSTALKTPAEPLPIVPMGRCFNCRFWIDAEQMQHACPGEPEARFNQHLRECWAENPSVVPPNRRAWTGPYDLCRHWQKSDNWWG